LFYILTPTGQYLRQLETNSFITQVYSLESFNTGLLSTTYLHLLHVRADVRKYTGQVKVIGM